MHRFAYNDTEYTLAPANGAWTVLRRQADGTDACVAAGLFPGLAPEAAQARAQAFVKTANPVGVRSVGPDVAHPTGVSTTHGIVKIIGPHVTHPNFVRWTGDSSSFTA